MATTTKAIGRSNPQLGKMRNVELRDALMAAEWHLSGRSRRVKSSRNWCVSASAAFCTLLLHTMLIAPAVFRIGGVIEREKSSVGSSQLESGSTGASTLTLIPTFEADTDEGMFDFAFLDKAISLSSPHIANPEPTASLEIAGDGTLHDMASATSPTNDAHIAAMFGRYINQVEARINRAWLRPRSPIGADHFECSARIEQDRSGKVRSIELIDCNGDVRWQRSLVSGIQLASPLAAPPEPAVYTPTLILSFHAKEYVSGTSRESEYEPDTLSAVAWHSKPSVPAADDSPKTFDDIRMRSGNIKLTISRTTTTWEFEESGEQSPGNSAQPAMDTE